MGRKLTNMLRRLTGPALAAMVIGAGLVTQAPVADVSGAQSIATNIGQTHYLPWDAQQFQDILVAAEGDPDEIDSPIRLITSFVSAVDGNTVAIDHWEDGYDADPINAPGTTTEILTLDEGDPQLLDNLVDLGQIGDVSEGYYDGGDKLVSTGAIVVNMGGWPSTATTLHAGSVVVREVNSYGYEFVSPVGEDTTYSGSESLLNTLWEYVGLLIVASEDDTTVTLPDASTVVLDEGDSHLVNGGIELGDGVTSDKPIGVFLATGDNGGSFEARLYGLLPTEAWFDGYITPVGSRNQTDQATRVFLYNPGAAAITVTWEVPGGTTGTISVPAGGQANRRLPDNAGMRFTSPGNPFYALQAVTTPEAAPATDRSSAYNWGLALTPSRALTPMVVIGYGPGSEDFTENDNPVWVAAQDDATLLVDLDADPDTGPLTDADGNQYDFACAVTELTPVLIKDIGSTSCSTVSGFTNSINAAGDADMTGARIYSDNGASIVAAWGQVPGLNRVQPAIDMGTAVIPFPVIDLQKDAEIVGDDGDGLALPGDTVRYTVQAINRGIAPIDDLLLTDDLPEHVSYVPGTTTADGNPVADSGSGTPFPLDEGILLPPAIDVGQTRVVTFDVVVDDPLPLDVTEFVNLATLTTDYGTYTDIATTPTTPRGSIGDRVWNDADGDGVQDGGEAGLVGVTVELRDDGGTLITTTTTGANGAYGFGELYPASYIVRVDPTSLPAGQAPTFDLDGVGTAHEASVALAAGEDRTDADFGYATSTISLAKTVYTGHDGGASCPGGELAEGENGDDVTYCFRVTNTGAVALVGVGVDDPDLGIDQSDMALESGNPALLGVGQSVVWSYETTVDGDLVNEAEADAFISLGGVRRTATDTAEVDEIGPSISIEKTVYAGHDGGASCEGGELLQVRAGDEVTYCFLVTNTGETNLSAVSVTDNDLGVGPGDLTHALLTPGQAVTLHVEAQADGDLVNTASVVATSPAGAQPTDSDTAEVDETHPALEVDKSIYAGHDGGSSCPGGETLVALDGDEVTWCFDVTNTGDVELTDLTVDDLPLGVDESDLTVVSGSLASLAPGADATLILETTAAGDVANTVTVTGVPPVGPPVDDDDPADLDVVDPDIDVEKSVQLGHDDGAGCATAVQAVEGEPDQPVTWCFRVTNAGDATLTDIGLDDADLGVDQSDLTVLSGSLGSLAPGATVELYLEGTIDGDLLNTVTATGTPPGGPVVEATDDAEVTEVVPAYELSKTVYRGHDGGSSCEGVEVVQARAGDEVTWCFVVTNTGETVLDVRVTDPDLGLDETVTDLEPGDSGTLFVEGTVDGDLLNTATGSGVPPWGPPIPDEDTAEVDEIHPAIQVDKTVDLGDSDGADCPGVEQTNALTGDVVTWCFEVTNTGDVDLADVRLDDPALLADETDMTVSTGSLATLPVGGSVTLYLEGAASADLDNTVTATATPPVGPDVDDEDDAGVNLITPGIEVQKTVYEGHDGGARCDAAGESVQGVPGTEVTWCFEVTNLEDSSVLNGVTLDDADLGIDESDLTVLAGDLATVPADGTVSLYHEGTIDGDLVNTVTATGTPPLGPDVSDDDTAEVDEVNAGIVLDKAVYGGGPASAGSGCATAGGSFADEQGAAVTWCFTITNTGDAPLTDLRLDDLDLGVDETDLTVLSGSLASLAPGQSVVLYVTGTVDGDLVNTATATGIPPVGPDVTDDDSAEVDELVPAVEIDKTVYAGHDGGASCPGGELVVGRPGDAVTWCIEVRNTGDTDLLGRVTDADLGLDESVELAPDASETFVVEGAIDGDLVNTGAVEADSPGGQPVSDEDTAEVDEVNPAIAVQKTVHGGHDAGASCPGGDSLADEDGRPVTWCFVVTNLGDTPLTDVRLDDADLGVDQSDLTVLSGSLDSLGAGDSVALYLEGTLDGDLVNDVTVTGTPVVGPDVEDEDSAEVEVLVPGVEIAKTVYAGHDGGTSCEGVELVHARAGDEVTWCFLVTNTGEVPLDVTVDDPDTGFTGTVNGLAPGADETLFAEGTVDGDLVNTATVTGETPDGDEVTDDDDAEVDEIHPDIEVQKTVDAGHQGGSSCTGGELLRAEVGDDATWCFVITNPGDVTLTDLDLTDGVLGIDESDVTVLSGSPASLPPGGTIRARYHGTVSEDLVNTVTVGGTAPDDSREVDSDTAAVEVIAPQIGLAKTVIEGPTGNGDGTYTLTYRLRVANAGETALRDIQVTDDLTDTFVGVESFRVDDLTSNDLRVNWPGYTGRPGGSVDLLAGVDTLGVGERGDLHLTVTVRPGNALGPHHNTAGAVATSPGGEDVDDTSDSGTDADPTASNPGEPGDSPGGTDDPVPVEFPPVDLEVTKTVEDARMSGDVGTAHWQIVVGNNGPGDDPGPITVVDRLDERLRFVSAEGEGWDCGIVGRTVTCVWDAPLAAGDETSEIGILTETTIARDETIPNVARVSSSLDESRTDNNEGEAAVRTEVVGGDTSGGLLPRTGTSVAGLVALGLALLLGGRILQRRGRAVA